mmetsp:Transcript_28978/g.96225  ORF Transcript_28978/g.96225 Transcript_28978/m.96225 type:complete len:341 (+) Transcript_28978:392-1414(+)
MLRPALPRRGLQARPHAAARIPRLLPAAERHAGARILPDRFLVLHVWVDLPRLLAPRLPQGRPKAAGALEQRRRLRNRRLAGLRGRLVASAPQHAPPRHERRRQRPRHHDRARAHLRAQQPGDRRCPQRGAAVAAVLLRARDEPHGHVLALRVDAVPGRATLQQGVGLVGAPRAALLLCRLHVPRTVPVAAADDAGARLPHGHRRLLDALWRGGHPGRPRHDTRRADGAHLSQHHRRVPRQLAHGLHLAADGAPPLADDAHRAPRGGAALRARLLQEARLRLPRVEPRRVRQVQRRRPRHHHAQRRVGRDAALAGGLRLSRPDVTAPRATATARAARATC